MTTLYRVDNELLTIKEIDKEFLHDVPLSVWLPVVFGDGDVCYFEDRYIAYNVLLNLISTQVEDLTEKHTNIMKEFAQ